MVCDGAAAECLGGVLLQFGLAGDGKLISWDHPVNGEAAARGLAAVEAVAKGLLLVSIRRYLISNVYADILMFNRG